MAKFLHFYPGHTVEDVMNMDIDDFNELYMAITTIEAREMIDRCNVAAYGTSNKEGREKFRKHLYKLAFPTTGEENTVSGETIARMFGSGGAS